MKMFFEIFMKYSKRILKYKDSVFKNIMHKLSNLLIEKEINNIINSNNVFFILLDFIKFEIFVHTTMIKLNTNKIVVKNSWIAYTTFKNDIKSFWIHIEPSTDIHIDIYSNSDPLTKRTDLKIINNNTSISFTAYDGNISKDVNMVKSIEKFIKEYIRITVIYQFENTLYKFIEGGNIQ